MSPEYRHDYNRGWRSGQSTVGNALERADDRREPNAWYDGYFDYAAGRPKYHLATCTDQTFHETCWETSK